MRYTVLVAGAALLLGGCAAQYVLHHTALRDLRPGMSSRQVDSVLGGSYVRRGLLTDAPAGETEVWQVQIGENYGRYVRSGRGKWESPRFGEYPDAAVPYVYWIGFENGRLAWWGRTGDWGTASKDKPLINVKVLNIQTEAPAKEQD